MKKRKFPGQSFLDTLLFGSNSNMSGQLTLRKDNEKGIASRIRGRGLVGRAGGAG
ncbi:hypothetical protein ACLQ8Z_10260 [Bordetella hinzii]|uniref:hypothetical protein n=1 Tax=Bordetella hinzii TaxID=103855 RepID=UPI001E459422|nr:hypothetical protein [Bordetella hinzii]